MTFPVFAPGDVLNASDMNAVGLWRVKANTTFTTASSVTCDNVFTTDYPYYVVNIRYITSSTTDFSFRLRVGGVSAATNYNQQLSSGNGATAAATRSTSQTSWTGGGNTNGTFYSHSQFVLFGPQLAEPTTMQHWNNQNAGAYTNPINKFYTGNHSDSTIYDGFELLIGGSTITGTYAVYGYRA